MLLDSILRHKTRYTSSSTSWSSTLSSIARTALPIPFANVMMWVGLIAIFLALIRCEAHNDGNNCLIDSVANGVGPFWKITNAPQSSAWRSFYGFDNDDTCMRRVNTHDVTCADQLRMYHNTNRLLTRWCTVQFGSGTGMAFNALEEFIACVPNSQLFAWN